MAKNFSATRTACVICGDWTNSAYGVCNRTEACQAEYGKRYRNQEFRAKEAVPIALSVDLPINIHCASCGRKSRVGRLGICNREECKHELFRRQRIEAERVIQRSREKAKEAHSTLFCEVLAHYGELCACCGSIEYLSIDHVDGDGKRHRLQEVKGSLISWLKSENFPEGFQTLCRQCNTSKGRGFTCALHDYKFLGPEELRFYFG